MNAVVHDRARSARFQTQQTSEASMGARLFAGPAAIRQSRSHSRSTIENRSLPHG